MATKKVKPVEEKSRSTWESTDSQLPLVESEEDEAMTTEQIKVIGLRKKPNEPLVSLQLRKNDNKLFSKFYFKKYSKQ